MKYRLLVDLEVIKVLDGLTKGARKRLLDQFEKIRLFPEECSDANVRDHVGR